MAVDVKCDNDSCNWGKGVSGPKTLEASEVEPRCPRCGHTVVLA